MSVDEIQEKLTNALCARIIDAKLGYAVVDSTIGNSMDFITQNKLFSMLVDEKAKEGIRDKLAEKVNAIISDKAAGRFKGHRRAVSRGADGGKAVRPVRKASG